jgi:hypothetical protein
MAFGVPGMLRGFGQYRCGSWIYALFGAKSVCGFQSAVHN